MYSNRFEEIKVSLRGSRNNMRQALATIDELSKLDTDVAIKILKRLYQEENSTLRMFAAMGFKSHRTETSWEMLLDILATESDSNVLAEAIRSLAEFGNRAVFPLKQLFERSSDWLVREIIITVLIDTSKDPHVLIDAAKIALANENKSTKELGVVALSRLLNTPLKQQAIDLFIQLAQDTN